MIGTVYPIIDGNKSDICIGQENLRIITYLEIVSAKPAHILDNNRTDPAFVYQSHKALPIWTVKIGSRIAIVYKEHGVQKAIIISVFL